MNHKIMFGYYLGVKCVCFHEMEFMEVICETTEDGKVLMNACLIWELEASRSFLHADLFSLIIIRQIQFMCMCVCVFFLSSVLFSLLLFVPLSSLLPCVVFFCLTFIFNSILLNTEKKMRS